MKTLDEIAAELQGYDPKALRADTVPWTALLSTALNSAARP